jgi:GDSL-like Lipase/Acylhydrolase family
MKRLAANIAAVAAAALSALAVLEIVLRLWPGVISEAVLANFEEPLRRALAARLDLPLKQARRCLSANERSDHGPELCLIAPRMPYRLPADPADLAEGAQVVLPHDARGFCNPPEKAERPRAAILSVGDSFTWCTAVPAAATFTALLETMLGDTTYNLGVPGVGPYEYLEILRRFGLALAPRLVLFNIYEGNDLRDAVRFAEQLAREPPAADRRPSGSAVADRRSPGKVLFRHSYALNFVAGAIEHLVEQWRPQQIDFRYAIGSRRGQVLMNAGQSDRDEVRYARRLLRGEISLGLWDRALEDFATLAREHDFKAVVTYIPAAYTANDATITFMDPAIGPAMAAMSRAQRAYLRRRCEAHHLTFIDLTEPVQAALATFDLAYFPSNLHLTKAGHEIVAAALAPRLRELLATDASHRSRRAD